MKLFFILAVLFINITAVYAGNKTCTIESVVRCMCPASMFVDCGTDGSGNLKNDEKVKSVKLAIVDKNTGTKRYITLNEADLSNFKARDFYGANYSKELRGLAGAKDKEEISADNLVMDSGVKLYEDTNGTVEVGAKASSSSSNCSYVDDFPQIANYSGACGGKKICVARIQCKDLGGAPYIGIAACPASKGSCPSATDCAADQLVSTEKDPGLSAVGTSTLKGEGASAIGK